MKIKIKNEFNIKVENLEALCTSSKRLKKRIPDSTQILQYYEHGYEIIIYELCIPFTDENARTFYVQPIEIVIDRSFGIIKNKVQQALFYVKPFTFTKDMTVQDLYINIFMFYRRLIPDLEDSTLEDFNNNEDDSDYVNQEFRKYFGSQNTIPFRIFIENNIPDSYSIYNNSSKKCEFCEENCNEYCGFTFGLETTIEEIFNLQKIKRPFSLLIEFLKPSGKHLIRSFDIREGSKNIFVQNASVSIYDCLEAFRAEEQLESDNAWYCNVCKKHQEAFKKLELYKAPNILIVQLKRFKIKSTHIIFGSMANKKNDSLVDFPLDNLDISQYIVGDEKHDAVYELFAISQHYGSLSGGHYTALCRNQNNWYEYDDERVTNASNSRIVSPAAYLLFYRKKSLR